MKELRFVPNLLIDQHEPIHIVKAESAGTLLESTDWHYRRLGLKAPRVENCRNHRLHRGPCMYSLSINGLPSTRHSDSLAVWSKYVIVHLFLQPTYPVRALTKSLSSFPQLVVRSLIFFTKGQYYPPESNNRVTRTKEPTYHSSYYPGTPRQPALHHSISHLILTQSYRSLLFSLPSPNPTHSPFYTLYPLSNPFSYPSFFLPVHHSSHNPNPQSMKDHSNLHQTTPQPTQHPGSPAPSRTDTSTAERGMVPPWLFWRLRRRMRWSRSRRWLWWMRGVGSVWVACCWMRWVGGGMMGGCRGVVGRCAVWRWLSLGRCEWFDDEDRIYFLEQLWR